MSTLAQTEELLSSSIDDYLLALASGIYNAQKQLSEMAIEIQPGQPSITYQLPKLEFELKLSFQLGVGPATTPAPGTPPDAVSGSPASGSPAVGTKKVLNIQPVNAQSEPGGARAEAASLIRGSFVAVPAGGGQPAPVLRTSLEKRSGRRYGITAEITSAVGERLSGREVELNIDVHLSNLLNKAHDLPLLGADEVQLGRGVGRTGSDGKVSSSLWVTVEEAPLRYVAVRLDALGETEILTFEI